MTKNKTDPYKDWTPLFKLNPQSDQRAKCQFLGYCDDTAKLTDETLEVNDISIEETIKQLLPDMRTIQYSIFGHYKLCYIVGDYLVKNCKIPVQYMQILYSKKFVGGCLFNISLNFNISEECKKKFTDPSKYINVLKDKKTCVGTMMDGTYTLELSVPQEENFLEKIKLFVLDDILKMHNDQFEKAQSEEEQIAVMENVKTKLNDKLESYKKFFDVIQVEQHPTKKVVLEKFKTIYNNPLFKEMIVYGLNLREQERIKEREAVYDPPNKNAFNLKELKKNPNKVDEIFASRK